MKKLKYLVLSAKLCKLTHLRAQLRNVTRCSSTYSIIVRYVEIRKLLPALKSIETDDAELTPAEERRLDALLEQFEPLQSTTKALQNDCTTISKVRTLFNAVIESFPDTEKRLTSSATVFPCTVFEGAIVKLQRGNTCALSREESSALFIRSSDECVEEENTDVQLSFAERALRNEQPIGHEGHKQYLDTRFLIPTSNTCERFFSRVGHALTSRRKSINTANLESQLFLHLNRDLWGSSDINELTS